MRNTYKRFVWRATRPVNTADCTNEWRYFLKYNINISIIIHFKQYLPSIIQSAMFTGRAARQTNRLYVLRMIVKLAYTGPEQDFIMYVSYTKQLKIISKNLLSCLTCIKYILLSVQLTCTVRMEKMYNKPV